MIWLIFGLALFAGAVVLAKEAYAYGRAMGEVLMREELDAARSTNERLRRELAWMRRWDDDGVGRPTDEAQP